MKLFNFSIKNKPPAANKIDDDIEDAAAIIIAVEVAICIAFCGDIK